MCGSSISKAISSIVSPITGALGLGGQGPTIVAPPPSQAQQAPEPVAQNRQAQQAADEQRRRRQRASGQQSTILTGPAGAVAGEAAGKTLLGA